MVAVCLAYMSEVVVSNCCAGKMDIFGCKDNNLLKVFGENGRTATQNIRHLKKL